MGSSMAGHLLAAGYPVNVYNRSKEKTNALVAKGAQWFDTVGDLAANSNVIITMVGYPADVEEIYFGAGKILDRANNAYFIDMTTSSPSLAARIAQEAEKRGCHSLDAPVSGGDIGARNAKLSIMVGGKQADFDAVLPILKVMGTNIVLQGGPGAGQHTKMCNQIVVAGTIMGVCEGLAYAKQAGLDANKVMESIGKPVCAGAALGVALNHAKVAHPAQEVVEYAALVARDGGCRWVGCTVPASWCEVDHLIAWEHGGRTDLDRFRLGAPQARRDQNDRGRDDDAFSGVTTPVDALTEQFQVEADRLSEERRVIRRGLSEDVNSLGRRLQVLNLLAGPALALLFGLAYSLVRRRKLS